MSNEIKFDEGGPAFPEVHERGEWNDLKQHYDFHYMTLPGMSLRDWFAGQTLHDCLFNAAPADIARNAYAIADAMIVERGKR